MSYTDDILIEAEGLGRDFAGRAVLDGVDLAVPAGSVLALLGTNGAGKTTTVRILATLLAPSRGRARVAGHDVVAERSAVRRAISLTGQEIAVDELLTGRENLELVARLRGLRGARARARADELLARVRLEDAAQRRTATYSGGMRRRLDLAASLITAPRVLFLDEPTTGLDPRSRLDVWAAVEELVGGGTTVLLTTQYLEEADRLADDVVLLDAGRVAARGTPAALKAQVGGQRLDLAAADAPALEAALDALGRPVVHRDAERGVLGVATDGGADDVRVLLADLHALGVTVERLDLHAPSLDDAFLALTRTTPEALHA